MSECLKYINIHIHSDDYDCYKIDVDDITYAAGLDSKFLSQLEIAVH